MEHRGRKSADGKSPAILGGISDLSRIWYVAEIIGETGRDEKKVESEADRE